jgi:4-amino-4-deoxy-L-arabinose transferase-like glycosyltransferase
LSFLGLTGLPLEASAHWLNMLLFGAVIWLAASETWRVTRSLMAAWLAALLLAASPVLVPVFSWAMSEPLSIFLGFLSLAFMLAYLWKENIWLLAGSALAGGLAFLTRYAAGAYLGAVALLLLVFDKGRMGRRLFKTAAFIVAGSLPTAAWMAYNITHTTTVSSRSVLTAASMLERVRLFWPQMEEVILFWLVPDSWVQSPPYPALLNHILSLGFVVGLVAWTVLGLRWMRKAVAEEKGLGRWQMALALFGGVYLGMIALVYFTTYPPITIGSRMLSPLMAAAFWLVVLLAVQTGRHWPQAKWLKNGMLVVVFLFGTWNAVRAFRIVQQNYQLGLGYNSIAWQASETMQAVRELPQDTLIVTNEETAILYLTGRASYPMAEIYVDTPETAFVRYGDGDIEDDPAEKLFHEREALLVVFDSLPSQVAGLYGSQNEAWAAALVDGLEVVHQGADGGIFRYP